MLLFLLFAVPVLSLQVRDVKVHEAPLRRNDASSVYCLAASSICLEPGVNFLASQVWPSARVASFALERHVDQRWTMCEFGCGPGLPSLTAAKLGCERVYATDLDHFALDLVQNAARLQSLRQIETCKVDLLAAEPTANDKWFHESDLFLFSDVFESAKVAQGAARITQAALERGARVWVFAQSDRAQREVYLDDLRQRLGEPTLNWQAVDSYPTQHGPDFKLWLVDVDETTVSYG
jgi:hypothetical protein